MPQRFDKLCRIFPPESEGKQCRSAVSHSHSVRDVFANLEQKGFTTRVEKKNEKLRSQIYAARRRNDNLTVSNNKVPTAPLITFLLFFCF